MTDAHASSGGPALPESPASPDLPASPDYRRRRAPRVPPVARGIIVFVLLAALVGALSGFVWHAVVHLPTYTMGTDGVATTTERGLTEVFDVDAWFCLLGAICGVCLGLAAWYLFRRLGWWVTLIAVAASGVAGLVAWRVGVALGPSDFAERISTAAAGAQLPIDFRLRSHAALLVWLLAGDLPVLLLSSLTKDAEDDGQAGQPWRLVRRRRPATRQVAPVLPGGTSDSTSGPTSGPTAMSAASAPRVADGDRPGSGAHAADGSHPVPSASHPPSPR